MELLKDLKLPKKPRAMLLMPLPQGVDHTLLDGNGRVARSDGLQISLIGAVDLRECCEKLSDLLEEYGGLMAI